MFHSIGVARGVAAAAALTLCGGAASAGTSHFWDWEPGDPVTDTYDPRGGTINYVQTSYDVNTNRLVWEVNFSEAPDSNLMTEAFTLVMNDGPSPIGEAGHLAVLYLDATGPDPVLTAYGYNGTSPNNSWIDGSEADGVQAPDQIASSLLDMSWINQLSVIDEIDGTRTMMLDIDATPINGHDPIYGVPDDWAGIGFDDFIGVWFHPYAEVDTAYEDGFLSQWSFIYPNRGWLDVINAPTVIPVPGAVVIIGLAGLVAVPRRRRCA